MVTTDVRHSARRLALLILLWVLPAETAMGQVVLLSPVSGYYDWERVISGNVEHQFDSAISGGGRFDRLRFELGLEGGGPISQNVRLSLATGYAHTRYGFSDSASPSCANPAACFERSPWSGVHSVDAVPGASLVLNDTLQIIARVPIHWEAEGGSDQNGLTAGLIGAVLLRLSQDFSATLGVGVQNEIEQRTSVFPVISLDWRLSHDLRLRTTGGPDQGGGGELLWGPADAIQLSLTAGWERRRFRLDGAAPNADGVGQYTAVPLRVGFRLNLTRSAYLTLTGGLAVAGRLEIDDAAGRSLREQDFDTAGLIRGGLRISF